MVGCFTFMVAGLFKLYGLLVFDLVFSLFYGLVVWGCYFVAVISFLFVLAVRLFGSGS